MFNAYLLNTFSYCILPNLILWTFHFNRLKILHSQRYGSVTWSMIFVSDKKHRNRVYYFLAI